MAKTIPTWISATPAANDRFIFGDANDSDNLKDVELQNLAWPLLNEWDTDDLPEWATNLYMTPAEKAKLTGIAPWADVSPVTTVNGVAGNVTLTQDDIPNGTTYEQTENNFSDAKDANLATAYSHALQTSGNPHQVTNTDVWLGNVADERQLSREAGNFSALTEKSDIQFHLADQTVIQDSSDGDKIKRVSNQTNLIWYAGYIQTWQPSINYRNYNFTGSTNYQINSIVTVWANIYKCIVTHQSSGSFAADLALGYWTLIGGGSGSGGNQVTAWAWAPVGSGVNPWDMYVDLTSGDLYYRDGSSWNLISWGGWGVSYETSPTTGDKLVFSFGVGADKIEESVIEYDPAWPTLTFPSSLTVDIESAVNFTNNTITYDNVTSNYTNNSVTNYDNTTTVNNNGNAINNTNNTVTNTNVTETYDNSSTITNNGTTNFNGTTNISNANITNLNVTSSVVWANQAHIERFVATAWQTTFTLANTPASPQFVWVSSWSGLYVKQNASDDYTVSGNDIIFNTGRTVGDVITIQYIESLGTPIADFIPMKKKTHTRTAWGGSSTETFADADILSDSVISGWTVTSGTQAWFREFDLSTPWQITINSTATETGTIEFTYLYAI